jgi:hypothetical protein
MTNCKTGSCKNNYVAYILLFFLVIIVLFFFTKESFILTSGALGRYQNAYAYCMNNCEKQDRRDRLSSDNFLCQAYCDQTFTHLARNNLPLPDSLKNPFRNMSEAEVKYSMDELECTQDCRKTWPDSDYINEDCYKNCQTIRKYNLPNRVNVQYS